MAGSRNPRATCATDSGQLDSGTLALQCSPAPLAVGTFSVAVQRPLPDRLAEAIRRGARRLPGDAGAALLQLVTPEALATMAVVLLGWAASHAIGVGEVVDLILLAAGLIFIGSEAVDGFNHLVQFAQLVAGAKSDDELDRAGDHLAKAVTALGVAAVTALLLRGGAKLRRAERYKPNVKGDPALPAGEGFTTKYGDITYSTAGSATDRALVLYHEQVHSFLSPKLMKFRDLRADLRMQAYERSAFLRYLEEALAEGYAQLRVHGIKGLPAGIRFPIANGYVTLRAVVTEAAAGTAFGTITIGGIIYAVDLQTGAP